MGYLRGILTLTLGTLRVGEIEGKNQAEAEAEAEVLVSGGQGNILRDLSCLQ